MANDVEEFSDSDDSVDMIDDPNENLDSLAIERKFIHQAIGQIQNYGIIPEANRKKNVADSIKYRKKGNKLYCSDLHGWKTHKEILDLYSKSMALAPIDSEELALAYGNRAALLLHLKKYEECIKDCDRALDITVSDYLEAKFLCRKAECLAALNDKIAKYVCEEALELFKQLTLDNALKSNYIEKLNNIKNSCLNSESKENKVITDKQQETLLDFPRQTEAPCASEAVRIKYNKKWGRHIVATREIEPGEIIAVEKNYYRFTYTDGMYFHCSNCNQFTWSSIPCMYCIYGVYCSEECRTQAWEKFHQFECEIYPLVWDIEQDYKVTACCLRLLLKATHEMGGIEQLRNEYFDAEKSKNHRTKGFSADGVFHSDRCRSILSLTNSREDLDDFARYSMSRNAAAALYYLANRTTFFFGKKLGVSAIDLLLYKEVRFIGALLLRIFYLFFRNKIMHVAYRSPIEGVRLGIITNPFCSLFNHSCDPNVNFIYSKDNEIIVYARYPIKKGEQLFRTYFIDFLEKPKAKRQELILEAYQFKCDCQPCRENWSSICLPKLKDLIGVKKTLELLLKLPLESLFKNLTINKEVEYCPETLKELKSFLKTLAAKASVYCEEYASLENCMFRAYNKAFGCWIVVPDSC